MKHANMKATTRADVMNFTACCVCNKLIAMFPSPCFYAEFEVLHQKRVMETPNKKKNP